MGGSGVSMKTFYGLPLVCGVLLLSACAPMPSVPREPMPGPPPSQTEPPQRHRPERPAERAPIERPERPAPAQAAVAGLLKQAWTHYRNGNLDGAIAVAERAQRLDPRNPETYLVLASSYFADARSDMAEQLARRGIAFSAPGTVVRGRLQSLLQQIGAAR